MSGEGDAATDPAPIVEIDIALDGNAPDQLVGVPVEVVVRVDERTDVLLVPVNALLARAEGGYALEVVADDGTTSIVPVETGLFGAGKVEVTSADIDEGTVVGVAGR
jgi:multidrug efflux pump subunit AcrA (membrane-fusion protein)